MALRHDSTIVLFMALTLLSGVGASTSDDLCLDSTPSRSLNGFNGIMFDVQVGAKDVVLQNFVTQVSSAWDDQRPASVWLAKNGSYASNLVSLNDQWQKVADAVVGPATQNSFVDLGLTLNHKVVAGTLQGVYIDLDDSVNVRYYNGPFEGQTIGSDENIAIRVGRGVGHTFGSQFTPRQFSGTVCYEVVPECSFDENLEVLLPPELDENNTHLVLDGASSLMEVTIIIPNQYNTAKFTFPGALDDAGSFDSTNVGANLYWTVNTSSDPCSTVYTGSIPWELFRTTLGGIHEERFSEHVYYDTEIDIEVTKPISLKPETLLLQGNPVSDGGSGDEGIVEDVGTDIADYEQGDMPEGAPIPPYVPQPTGFMDQEIKSSNVLLQDGHEQQYSRTVRTKIPFEVAFDLQVKLWSNSNVKSDHLRVAAAVIDSSVLAVEPNSVPVAQAEIELVTVIPLPLHLIRATVTVNDSYLDHDLAIEQDLDKRSCDEQLGLCTQYWIVTVNPEKCTMQGRLTVTVYGECHPDTENCLQPYPSTTEIEMEIVSHNFCGVTQKIMVQGDLSLNETGCNTFMRGQVSVSNPDGGAINRTDIVMVRAEPALKNSSFVTIFDESNVISILDYSDVLTQPDQVEFSFVWSGKELRCDVVAHVEVFVRVEFEATAPLLLSASSSDGVNLLSDEQAMHMVAAATVTISDEAPTENGNSAGRSDNENNSAESNGNATNGASPTTDEMSPAMLAAIITLSITLMVVVAGGVYVIRRMSASSGGPKPPAAKKPTDLRLSQLSGEGVGGPDSPLPYYSPRVSSGKGGYAITPRTISQHISSPIVVYARSGSGSLASMSSSSRSGSGTSTPTLLPEDDVLVTEQPL